MGVIDGGALDFADLPGRRSADPLSSVGDRASSLRVVEMDRSEGRTAHRHPHSEEIVYVERGHGHLWIEETMHPLRAGDVVHIPAGAAHATIPADGVRIRLICFFPHPVLADNLEDTDIEVT